MGDQMPVGGIKVDLGAEEISDGPIKEFCSLFSSTVIVNALQQGFYSALLPGGLVCVSEHSTASLQGAHRCLPCPVP